MGYLYSGEDFFDAEVAALPIKEIEIWSLAAGDSKTAVKKYRILPEHQGRSFTDLMTNEFKEVITYDPYISSVPAYSFWHDPIMSISGGLRINMGWYNNGVRISSSD